MCLDHATRPLRAHSSVTACHKRSCASRNGAAQQRFDWPFMEQRPTLSTHDVSCVRRKVELPQGQHPPLHDNRSCHVCLRSVDTHQTQKTRNSSSDDDCFGLWSRRGFAALSRRREGRPLTWKSTGGSGGLAGGRTCLRGRAERVLGNRLFDFVHLPGEHA